MLGPPSASWGYLGPPGGAFREPVVGAFRKSKDASSICAIFETRARPTDPQTGPTAPQRAPEQATEAHFTMCFCTFLMCTHFQNHSAEYQNTKMCVFLGCRPLGAPKMIKHHMFYYGFRKVRLRCFQGPLWSIKGGPQLPESTPDDPRNAKNMHFT